MPDNNPNEQEKLVFSEVADRVSTALERDPRTAPYAIQVIDNSGLVTIKGLVPTKEVKEWAEEVAERQEGVLSVTNALVVTNPEAEGDADLIPDLFETEEGERYEERYDPNKE